MQTVFPTETGYSSIYIVGFRKSQSENTAQRIGTVLVKREYSISGTSLVPVNNPDGLHLSDSTYDTDVDGETLKITDHESDIAVYKPKADLIVKGSYSVENSYTASVTSPGNSEQIWFERPVALPDDEDAAANMFGWEQRWTDARKSLGDVPYLEPNDTEPDYTNFDNEFFNAYRRDFVESGFPLNRFEPGSTITLRQTPDGSSTSSVVESFSLGNENISAKLYFHHKGSIDKEVHWCCRNIDEFKLDTLVVTPSQNTAYAVWRGVWDYDEYPQESYRQLKVKAEEVS